MKKIKFLIVILMFLMVGCNTNGKNNITMQDHHGMFINDENILYPIYSSIAIDSANLIGLANEKLESAILGNFYTQKEKLNIPINELTIKGNAKLLLNKNFKKPIFINVIYSDGEKEIIVPFEWKNDDYIQFDINNLKKNTVYTFQISYMSKNDDVLNKIESYMFAIVFK
ncbi:MAG: hypothetical protein SPI53_01595 [Erysipelotrichaceae bacterium]|nr:hypothetical protein [Erysipelotrichaceae bacterium]